MPFSPSRCPPSTKSGVGVYEDRGSSWPQVSPACPLTLPHTHYTWSSCLVGFLGWKHGWNRPNGRKLPMKRSLPDVFLTILIELDPPTIPPCIVNIMRMIFTFYSVSFWPSWSDICSRRQKVSNCQKLFPPGLEPSLRWLGHGQKKLHFVHSGQSYGGSKFNVFKNVARDWG